MRRVALLLLFAIAMLGVGETHHLPGGGIGTTEGGAAPNDPQDTDGDGLDDYIVCGDSDGDGVTETADVDACVRVLTDENRYIYVLPGDYAGPPAALAGTKGLIELNSHDTLECASATTTILHGSQWISGANASQVDRPVVSNDADIPHTDISVLNCGIDGGWPSGWTFDAADVTLAADTINLQNHLGQDIETGYDDHGLETGDGPFRIAAGSSVVSSTDAVYETTGDTITRAQGSFIDDGFQVGTIVVSSSVSNNASLTITNVAAKVLTSSTNLVNETDAASTFTQASILPSPLVVATDYWIIRVDDDTVKLASSYANATAGTPVPIDLITTAGVNYRHKLAPSSDGEAIGNVGMGIYFRGVDRLHIEGNHVKRTAHTCIYNSNSKSFEIINNYMDQCGKYGIIDAGGSNHAQLPGVYLFGDTVSNDFVGPGLISNNVTRRTGGGGFNTRGDDPVDNEIPTKVLYTGNTSSLAESAACFAFYSARDMSAIGNMCNDSYSALILDNSMGNFADQDLPGIYGVGGSVSDNAASRIFIDGFTGRNITSTSPGALQIADYTDGLTLSNINIDKITGNGMNIEQPLRGFVATNVRLTNVSGWGILITGAARTRDEGMIFRNIHIDLANSSNKEAMQSSGANSLNYSIWDGFYVGGVSSAFYVFRIPTATAHATFQNGTVSCTEQRYRGRFTEAQAAAYVCNAETKGDTIVTTNASSATDITFASGTGAFQSMARCDGVGGTWSTIVINTTRRGIYNEAALADSTYRNIRTENCVGVSGIDGADTTGAWDAVKLTDIEAFQDVTYFEGTAISTALQTGAFRIPAASTGVIVDGRSINCIDTTAGSCMLGDEDDLGVGSVWVDDTCDAACTNGTTCVDTNAATGSLQQCESAVWNVLD